MDREKAVEVIKQMFQQCSQIEGKSIILTFPTANNRSKDCQIHIKALDDDFIQSALTSIAKQNKLEVTTQGCYLIIF